MQRGFIQIPILIAIIIGVAVIGGAGYVGIEQYQKYQIQKIEQETIAREQERQTNDLLIAQQQALEEALEEARQEIEKIKSESRTSKLETEEKISFLESKLDSSVETRNEILPQDIEQYVTGVVRVSCWKAGSKVARGSGFLYYKSGEMPLVMTNRHIAYGKECLVAVDNRRGKTEKLYYAEVTASVLNTYQDFAIVKLTEDDDGNPVTTKTDLNNSIHSLNNCPSEASLGSPVVVIGYPAFTSQQIDLDTKAGQISYTKNNRAITNGIISSYDNSVIYPIGQLPYPHYFVSAKIDGGNSGGVALSKNAGKLCVLGIPTWLNIGNYETQGIVQNIHNIVKE